MWQNSIPNQSKSFRLNLWHLNSKEADSSTSCQKPNTRLSSSRGHTRGQWVQENVMVCLSALIIMLSSQNFLTPSATHINVQNVLQPKMLWTNNGQQCSVATSYHQELFLLHVQTLPWYSHTFYFNMLPVLRRSQSSETCLQIFQLFRILTLEKNMTFDRYVQYYMMTIYQGSVWKFVKLKNTHKEASKHWNRRSGKHKLIHNNFDKRNQNNGENTDVNTQGRPWERLPGEVN